MKSGNLIIVDNKTSIHDTVEQISNLISSNNGRAIVEIKTSLKYSVKAISIVEILKRLNKDLVVEMDHSNFLSDGNRDGRRALATLVINLMRS